mgnify:CR=1 FL=1
MCFGGVFFFLSIVVGLFFEILVVLPEHLGATKRNNSFWKVVLLSGSFALV